MNKKYRKHTAKVQLSLATEYILLIQEKARKESLPQGVILEEYLLGKRDFSKDLKTMFDYLSDD